MSLTMKKSNLTITHPELAKEYMAPPKNKLPVEEVLIRTHKKLWWKCSKCGHEWEATGNSRIRGTGCPACAGKVATKNNNLAVVYPELAKEYMAPPKNKLPVEEIIARTMKKLWWKCSKHGHEWQATGASRVKGKGCPFCCMKEDN